MVISTKQFIYLFVYLFTFLMAPSLSFAKEVRAGEKWELWGEQNQSAVGYTASNKRVTFSATSNVRVRLDQRPLITDYLLENMKLSGASYDKVNIMVIADAIHLPSGRVKSISSQQVFGVEKNTETQLSLPGIRSGSYKIVIKRVLLDFKKNQQDVVRITLSGTEGLTEINTDYSKNLSKLKAAEEFVLKNQKPVQYVFGENFEVPITNGYNRYTIQASGSMLMLPKLFNRKKYVYPHLLGDTHTGDAARCEQNPLAITQQDNLLQQAETYIPSEAWLKLNKPLVVMNANFFDMRKQKQNTSWDSNKCSSPFGVYFDNITKGPTGGTHNTPNELFAGHPYFVDHNDKKIALDTMVWFDDMNSHRTLVSATSPMATNVENTINQYIRDGLKMVAISGVSIHDRVEDPSITPDYADSEMTRTAISINEGEENIIYIYQGGDTDGGLDRKELHGLFKELDAENALELIASSYSALVLDDDQFEKTGAKRKQSSCDVNGAWCSSPPASQNKHKGLPGWLGISNN
ncbi:hypothetical protein MMK73_001563 [Providencia rettgeri]|nr:hypothetical protein [Providencia rettgeri]